MAYYKYKRVSTATQEKNGYGLATQERKIDEYCRKNGIEIAGSFEDAGITGATDDNTMDLSRPGMMELFNVLGDGDKIIVLNTSRLWRNDTSKVLIRHELKKINADIISIEQPNYSIYSSDPNDFLINGMMELLDQYDKMLITRKLAAGRLTKAKSGTKACGTAPYGYIWSNAQIIVDAPKADVVRDIFQSYAVSGNFSDVQRMTVDKGYKTNTDKVFSVQAIKNILHNDFYVGIVTHAGKKAQGMHAPIISQELFECVNRVS